jgi:uncharacterized protein YndB with AHSA1/START domain
MEITRQVVLEADVEEVWLALVDAEVRSEWLEDERPLDVIRADVGRSLTWRWAEPDRRGVESTVTVEIESTDDGRTNLTVTERAGSADCSLAAASIDVEAWDRRLLGLELRCLTGAASHVLV